MNILKGNFNAANKYKSKYLLIWFIRLEVNGKLKNHSSFLDNRPCNPSKLCEYLSKICYNFILNVGNATSRTWIYFCLNVCNVLLKLLTIIFLHYKLQKTRVTDLNTELKQRRILRRVHPEEDTKYN